MLDATREALGGAPAEANAERYMALLKAQFAEFPDDLVQMREQGLAYFRYFATEKAWPPATSKVVRPPCKA